MGRGDRYNGSGYYDPTAYQAIENIEKVNKNDERRVKRLLATIYYICNLAGFRIEDRIVLKDKKSGKVWR